MIAMRNCSSCIAALTLDGERTERIVEEGDQPAKFAQFLRVDTEDMHADDPMSIGVEVIWRGCEMVIVAIHSARPGAVLWTQPRPCRLPDGAPGFLFWGWGRSALRSRRFGAFGHPTLDLGSEPTDRVCRQTSAARKSANLFEPPASCSR